MNYHRRLEPEIEVVEGEVVAPDAFDKIMDMIEQQQRQGKLSRGQLRLLLQRHMNPQPDQDPGRALVSGIGGAIGSQYRWIGAAAGAGLGAIAWDFLQTVLRSRHAH